MTADYATVTITVYASIGNSDDKLTQKRWSDFQLNFADEINNYAEQIHGIWTSLPDAPYQNACICFEISFTMAEGMKTRLARLAAEYGQDSIAWATAQTEFVKPAKATR